MKHIILFIALLIPSIFAVNVAIASEQTNSVSLHLLCETTSNKCTDPISIKDNNGNSVEVQKEELMSLTENDISRVEFDNTKDHLNNGMAIHLNSEPKNQLATITRENVDHKIVFVFDGKAIYTVNIGTPVENGVIFVPQVLTEFSEALLSVPFIKEKWLGSPKLKTVVTSSNSPNLIYLISAAVALSIALILVLLKKRQKKSKS